VRINFDTGYVELQRSKDPTKIVVIIAAKQEKNPLQMLVNSAEINLAELLAAIRNNSGPIIKEEQNVKRNNT
jgi:hypothetical protein